MSICFPEHCRRIVDARVKCGLKLINYMFMCAVGKENFKSKCSPDNISFVAVAVMDWTWKEWECQTECDKPTEKFSIVMRFDLRRKYAIWISSPKVCPLTSTGIVFLNFLGLARRTFDLISWYSSWRIFRDATKSINHSKKKFGEWLTSERITSSMVEKLS